MTNSPHPAHQDTLTPPGNLTAALQDIRARIAADTEASRLQAAIAACIDRLLCLLLTLFADHAAGPLPPISASRPACPRQAQTTPTGARTRPRLRARAASPRHARILPASLQVSTYPTNSAYFPRHHPYGASDPAIPRAPIRPARAPPPGSRRVPSGRVMS